MFNLCRGTVAPGRFGYVAHELEEVAANGQGDPEMVGPYFGLRFHGKSRGLLSHFGVDTEPVPNQPFATNAYWLPTTRVGVRIPEAVLLPAITVRSADRFPVAGNPPLDDRGLPGFRLAGSEWVDDRLRLAVAGALRPLTALGAPYAGVRVDRGLVAVFRNGFVADDAGLDRLVSVAAQIADGLVALATPMTAPQPFDVPLPAPDLSSWPRACAIRSATSSTCWPGCPASWP